MFGRRDAPCLEDRDKATLVCEDLFGSLEIPSRVRVLDKRTQLLPGTPNRRDEQAERLKDALKSFEPIAVVALVNRARICYVGLRS